MRCTFDRCFGSWDLANAKCQRCGRSHVFADVPLRDPDAPPPPGEAVPISNSIFVMLKDGLRKLSTSSRDRGKE